VSTDLKNGDRAEALALQPDGKLVAAGSAYKTAFDNQGPYGADIVAIARYNAK